MCFGDIFGPKTENVCRNFHHCPKIHRNKALTSVVGSTSKMNNHLEYIVVGKGRFGKICVLGTCLLPRVKIPVETFITVQKHTRNEPQRSIVGSTSK